MSRLRTNFIRNLRPDEPIPEGHPRRYANSVGYIRLRWKVAPNTYVEELEHRVVMGRPEGLHVHHINGDKADNRPENLVVLTAEAHAWVHQEQEREADPERGHRFGGHRSADAQARAERAKARRDARDAITAQMRAMYEAGAGTVEIAAAYGVDASGVSRRLRQRGTVMRQPGRTTLTPARKPRPRRSKDTGPSPTVRQAVRLRAGQKCERKGCDLTWVPADMQHRRARAMGGSSLDDTNSPVNLALLCRKCHIHVESRPLEALEDGWRVRQGDDPATVPIRHHELGLVLLTDNYEYGAAA